MLSAMSFTFVFNSAFAIIDKDNPLVETINRPKQKKVIKRNLQDDLVPRVYDKDWSYYSEGETKAYTLKREFKQKESIVFALRQAKRGIINGDLELAKFFLSKINDKRTKLRLVKQRYLSIISFIEGRYKESLKLISNQEYNETKNYRQVCLLRIMNLVALDDVKNFLKEVGSCQTLTFKYSPSNQFWLTQLMRVKQKNENLLRGNLLENLRRTLASTEFTEIWMKLALYLNKEEIILKYVSSLPGAAYRSKKIRELIGFAYYRVGKVKKALEFIEDIESPNADNIRGNINLLESKFELAFGHFKLALQKKENSQNALQRAIPLSYLLGQWQDGLDMLKRIISKDLTAKRKVTLETLFFIRKGDFSKAQENLNYLEEVYNKNFPREINLMDSYVALSTGNKERLEKASSELCQSYDGLNCWLNLQVLNWENIGLTMGREENTFVLEDFDIEKLKGTWDKEPLDEAIFVDQKDIEELDNLEIKIDPRKLD